MKWQEQAYRDHVAMDRAEARQREVDEAWARNDREQDGQGDPAEWLEYQRTGQS